jgi:MoxR-like ATPase
MPEPTQPLPPSLSPSPGGSPPGAVERAATNGLLDALGIIGWRAREPVVVAALATEEPLLLVGPHGTAKSLLLERLAEAMNLNLRHYNASILNFDDLIGFPVPDGETVRYLRTPGDAWDAEAIFVDELSRCRPDMQNRLLPLIHERRLQGRRLERLRFRWSAMNPPPPPDADPEEPTWLGAEPLDVALADRFAWVVEVPDRPTGADRLRLIRGAGPTPGGAAELRAAVERARGALVLTERTHGEGVAAYVDVVADVLDRARLPLSGRRLAMLFRNIVAVVAASGPEGSVADGALLALTWSLPQRANAPVGAEPLLRAHRAALSLLERPLDPTHRALLRERDPLARVSLALGHPDDHLVAATISDARAMLEPAARLAFSVCLFPILATTRSSLPAIVFEALAEDVARVNRVVEHTRPVCTADSRYWRAGNVSQAAATLDPADAWLLEVMWAAWEEDFCFEPAELVAFGRLLVRTFREPRSAA